MFGKEDELITVQFVTQDNDERYRFDVPEEEVQQTLAELVRKTSKKGEKMEQPVKETNSKESKEIFFGEEAQMYASFR